MTYFAYLPIVSELCNILFWLVIAYSGPFLVFFRVKHPQISQLHIYHPQKVLPYTRPRPIELLCTNIGSRVRAVALLNKKSHRTRTCCPHVASRPLIGPEQTLAGDLPNVITHAKFEINWYKIETGEGLKFHVLALLRQTTLTRRAVCD